MLRKDSWSTWCHALWSSQIESIMQKIHYIFSYTYCRVSRCHPVAQSFIVSWYVIVQSVKATWYLHPAEMDLVNTILLEYLFNINGWFLKTLAAAVFCGITLALSKSWTLLFTEIPTTKGCNCTFLDFILSTLNHNSSYLWVSWGYHMNTESGKH